MSTIERMLEQKRPLLMGVLNVTPDSFSDGGRFDQAENAIRQIETMLSAGADIIDIGGESTRPNAEVVSEQAELDRVIPVIEKAVREFEPYISIDTSKLAVMREACKAGARMINDVNALRNPGCVEYAASKDMDICLMHMQGTPKNMQSKPDYANVVQEVSAFLTERAQTCQQAGIDKNRIVLDPGFGFGKTLEHNVTLFKEMKRLLSLKYPLLIGVSRKTMLGDILEGKPVEERQLASVMAAVKAAYHYNAQIIRVHDVPETVEAMKVWSAL